MKERIIALLLTMTTVISLTACGAAFTCEVCGEEKTGKKYKETLLGEKVVCCKDCKEDIEELKNFLNSSFN